MHVVPANGPKINMIHALKYNVRTTLHGSQLPPHSLDRELSRCRFYRTCKMHTHFFSQGKSCFYRGDSGVRINPPPLRRKRTFGVLLQSHFVNQADCTSCSRLIFRAPFFALHPELHLLQLNIHAHSDGSFTNTF
jgi:hypothetical protein